MIEGMTFGMKTAEGNKAVNIALTEYLKLYKDDNGLADEFLHHALTTISLTHPEVADYNVRQNIVLLAGELDFLLDNQEIAFFDEDECFGDDIDDLEGAEGC